MGSRNKRLGVLVLCLAVVLFPVFVAGTAHAEVAISSPSVQSGDWTNGIQAFSSNNQYANTNSNNAVHTFSGYGLNLSGNISRVEVGAEAYVGLVQRLRVRVSWNGGSSWSGWSSWYNPPGADNNNVYWWNLTNATVWDAAKLRDTNFYVQIQYSRTGSNQSAYLDWIPVRVSYIPPDLTPPRGISNLLNTTFAQDFILWAWTDPTDIDFSRVEVDINGSHVGDVTKGVQIYNASGLAPDTAYTIGTRTVDIAGNRNTTWVNYTSMTAPLPDVTPPGSVTNLSNLSFAGDYILWGWVDPQDPDFEGVMVYLDGELRGNVSRGAQGYNVSNLASDSEHTVSTRTFDSKGNINQTWVNHTARTAPTLEVTPEATPAPTQGQESKLESRSDGVPAPLFDFGRCNPERFQVFKEQLYDGDLSNDPRGVYYMDIIAWMERMIIPQYDEVYHNAFCIVYNGTEWVSKNPSIKLLMPYQKFRLNSIDQETKDQYLAYKAQLGDGIVENDYFARLQMEYIAWDHGLAVWQFEEICLKDGNKNGADNTGNGRRILTTFRILTSVLMRLWKWPVWR